jgi:hypothetical protein
MAAKTLFRCSFLIVSILIACCYGDDNVLDNEGFESGTTGWSARGGSFTTVTSSPPPHGGSRSGRGYNRTSTWHGIQQDMMGKMVEDATYTVSGWVRTSSSASSDIHISFEQTDGDGTNYHWAANGTASNSGWTQVTGSFTLSVTGTLSGLVVYVEGPASDIDIYFDDAVVYGPEPGPTDPNATGTINTGKHYQEIEGFGAAGAWYENYLVYHQNDDDLYDLLFGDLGLDIYRVRNTYDQGSGGANYMNNTGTIVGEALTRNPNLKIMISSWSPPGYLKSNGDVNG